MQNSPITLVLGASTNPSRYSNMAIQRLVANNIPTIAVGLRPGTVAGIDFITDIPNDVEVDTVTLYVGPQHQEEWVEKLLSLNPRRVIFNPGTENTKVIKTLTDAGIFCETACTLVMLGVGTY